MSTTEYLGHAAFVGEEAQRPPAGNAATANFPAATTAPHNGHHQQQQLHRRPPTTVAPKSPLPDRTKFGEDDDEADDADIEEEEDDDDCEDEEEDEDVEEDEEVVGASSATRGRQQQQQSTKDCVDYEPSAPPLTDVGSVSPPSVDETDHVHHRFVGAPKQTKNGSSSSPSQQSAAAACGGRLQLPPQHEFDLSGLSSAVSSAAPSTVCSPLSTPTRHMPASPPQHHSSHRHCCRKSAAAAKAAAEDAGGGGGGGGSDDCGGSSTMAGFQQSPHHHLHHHHHNQQHHHNAYHASAASGGGCKKLQKFDPRKSPSPYRQLLPVVLCILSFATVFSLLIVYMDTTEIRHKQFKLNMSRDSDLHTVAQDNPTLIAFLREIHMRKYPMHFQKNARDTPGADPQQQQHQQFNFSSSAHRDEPAARMARYVADLVGGKTSGAVIQSLPGPLGQFMTAPWLAESLNWGGVIVEPEPRRFFTLRKENAPRTQLQLVHACVSPQPYPKEVVIHNEDSEVRINSLLDEETSWFNSRVKCFPLYTIMLACQRVEYDLLSLGVHGHELEILHTLPFDKIKIDVISIHLTDDMDDARSYLQAITKFLVGKAYKFQKSFGRNYFYQRINSTSRTRKKDILLLKTP